MIGFLILSCTPCQRLSADPPHASPSAHSVLQAALKDARATHRRVFVQVGSSWCKPCHLLWNEIHQPNHISVLRRYYVVIKLDGYETKRSIGWQNAGTEQQVLKWTTKMTGIPAFFILGRNGELLDSSIRLDGGSWIDDNTIADRNFVRLFQATAIHASAPDIAAVKSWIPHFKWPDDITGG